MEACLSAEADNPLSRIIRNIMYFVGRCHKDFQKGNTQVVYNEEEFPLPSALKAFIKYRVARLEDSNILRLYFLLLFKPNRIDNLIMSFINTFTSQVQNNTDLNFMEWIIRNCLVAAVFFENGFTEAPFIAVETIRTVCCVHKRYSAFHIFSSEKYIDQYTPILKSIPKVETSLIIDIKNCCVPY